MSDNIINLELYTVPVGNLADIDLYEDIVIQYGYAKKQFVYVEETTEEHADFIFSEKFYKKVSIIQDFNMTPYPEGTELVLEYGGDIIEFTPKETEFMASAVTDKLNPGEFTDYLYISNREIEIVKDEEIVVQFYYKFTGNTLAVVPIAFVETKINKNIERYAISSLEDEGLQYSYVRIQVDEDIVGAADLVDTTHNNAGRIRIMTPIGIKSWRVYDTL